MSRIPQVSLHNPEVHKDTNIADLALEAVPTRRERKAAATRRALFEAGLDAFGRRPFGLVSVIDLTEAVDVAKGVFYLHFKSKDEFLIELFRDVLARFLDELLAALAPVPTRSTRTRAAANQYIVFAAANPSAARFLLRMSGYFPDEIGAPCELVRVRTEYRQRLAAALHRPANRSPGEADASTAAILDSCCWGLIGSALQFGTGLPEEQVMTDVASSVLRMASHGQRRA